MNTLILLVGVVLAFTGVVLAEKFLGELGVAGFMVFATITANIMIVKGITVCGIAATAGNVMFATNFLATDILNEKYGKKVARKALSVAIACIVAFLIATQILMLYAPNEFDISQESLKTLFTIMPRITLASVVLFALSNLLDINLYAFLKKKTCGKHMWLRNNLSTMLCNGGENFLFYAIAFLGVYDIKLIVSMAVSATVIEVILAALDTPFLYLATEGTLDGKRGKLKTV